MPSGTKEPPGALTVEVGAILRAQMTRRSVTLLDLSQAVSISRAQLSKMLRGRAHIDIEQFEAICSFLALDSGLVWSEARSEVEGGPSAIAKSSAGQLAGPGIQASGQRPPGSEVARRLRLLLQGSTDDTLHAASTPAVGSRGRIAEAVETDDPTKLAPARDSDESETLKAIAEGLGVRPDYLTTENSYVVESVEAELEFERVMQQAGVAKIAARGALTPDALRAITRIISKRMEEK